MSPTLLMLAALSPGQPLPAVPLPGADPGQPPAAAARAPGFARITAQVPDPPRGPVTEPPAPITVPLTIPSADKIESAAAPEEEAAAAERWFFMRSVQGTWLGALLDDNRTKLTGWIEMSYTPSTASVNNQPVVWNDRANKFLVNQFWTRLERSVVTEGTTDITWGYKADLLFGSD